MLTYLLLIITLYLAGNTYIFIRATQALKVKPLGVKILLTVLFWTCALSFFGTMLARNLEMPVFTKARVITTLSLSTGTTLEAAPICKAW